MGDHQRALAGAKAHDAGKVFEEVFQWACRNVQAACTRIPDGCRVVRGRNRGGTRLVRCKSPFDWIVSTSLGGRPITILCDTKTTAGDSFPYSKIDADQVAELRKHEANGILAGYVIEFREVRQVYWYPALALMACRGRGSIKPGGILLGSNLAFDVRRIFTPSHHTADAHAPGRILG